MVRIIDAAETIKPEQLQQPVKILAAAIGPHEPGTLQGRRLRRQGNAY